MTSRPEFLVSVYLRASQHAVETWLGLCLVSGRGVQPSVKDGAGLRSFVFLGRLDLSGVWVATTKNEY